MEIFSSKLQEPYYTYIRDGIKIYEMRVNDEKRKKMKIGDIWKFKNANNENLLEYNCKKIYKSFEEAIKKVGYKRLLPNSKSISEAIKTYNAFDNGMYEVDAKGLDRLDRSVLIALIERFGGGPVGLSTLAIAVGEETETVESVAEPFLVRNGFMARTPRGRIATALGWEHVGRTPPPGIATLFDTPAPDA